MIHTRTILSALLILGWLADPSSSHARDVEKEQYAKLVVVRVLPQSPKIVAFDSPVYSIVKPLPKGIDLQLVKSTTSAVVTMEKDHPAGFVNIILRAYDVVLWVQSTSNPKEAAQPVVIMDTQALEIADLKSELAQNQQNRAELTTKLEQTERGRDQLEARITTLTERSDRNAEFSLLRQFNGKHATITLMESPTDCRGTNVMLCGLQWNRLNEKGVLRFVIYNATPRELDVAQVFVMRGGVNLAGAAIIDEIALERGTSGKIRSWQRVQGSVIVNEPHQVGDEIQLVIAGNGLLPIASRAVSLRVIDLRPQNGEGRTTIRVQPSIGAVWLANPVDKEELAAATLMGLGARVSYGLHTKFALEADLTGIQSNDASFNDVPVDGMMGDILRSTKGARVLFGGAVRIGTKYQPFFRLGVGAQVVDHDVRFVTGQGTTTGPGDGLSFDLLGWFGSGLDIKLGSHWTIGAAFSAAIQTGSAKSVEGGIQLGYGWGGYVRD